MLQRWKVLELIITITRRLLEASAVAQTCSCMLMQHAYFYIHSCLVTFPPARDCLRQTNCFASGMVQNFWQISTFSFLRIGSRENQSGIRTVMLGSIYGKHAGKGSDASSHRHMPALRLCLRRVGCWLAFLLLLGAQVTRSQSGTVPRHRFGRAVGILGHVGTQWERVERTPSCTCYHTARGSLQVS